jgi:hypothetical protein
MPRQWYDLGRPFANVEGRIGAQGKQAPSLAEAAVPLWNGLFFASSGLLEALN